MKIENIKSAVWSSTVALLGMIPAVFAENTDTYICDAHYFVSNIYGERGFYLEGTLCSDINDIVQEAFFNLYNIISVDGLNNNTISEAVTKGLQEIDSGSFRHEIISLMYENKGLSQSSGSALNNPNLILFGLAGYAAYQAYDIFCSYRNKLK